jgi:tetratricopeptide (TPR) repeat protein
MNVVGEGLSETAGGLPNERQWYFSGPVLLLAFLFLTPAWAILILADRRRSKELKAIAALVALGYVVLVIVLYEKTGISAYNEGVQQMDSGQIILAEQQFKLALQRNPDLAEAHLNLGRIYLERGSLDGAQIETEKAVHIRAYSEDNCEGRHIGAVVINRVQQSRRNRNREDGRGQEWRSAGTSP